MRFAEQQGEALESPSPVTFPTKVMSARISARRSARRRCTTSFPSGRRSRLEAPVRRAPCPFPSSTTRWSGSTTSIFSTTSMVRVTSQINCFAVPEFTHAACRDKQVVALLKNVSCCLDQYIYQNAQATCNLSFLRQHREGHAGSVKAPWIHQNFCAQQSEGFSSQQRWDFQDNNLMVMNIISVETPKEATEAIKGTVFVAVVASSVKRSSAWGWGRTQVKKIPKQSSSCYKQVSSGIKCFIFVSPRAEHDPVTVPCEKWRILKCMVSPDWSPFESGPGKKLLLN